MGLPNDWTVVDDFGDGHKFQVPINLFGWKYSSELLE